jgi:DNA-binding transcriptional LysR family regulator
MCTRPSVRGAARDRQYLFGIARRRRAVLNFDTVSFDQLRYFVAVADTGTTRAAAARLHVSQPPLSRQIRALEAELGVDLFERTPRGMALRPEGQALLRRARRILSEVGDAVDEAKRLSLSRARS